MADIVPYTSQRGAEYVQLFQRIPFLEHFYFDFEKNHEALPGVTFASEHWLAPIVITTLYVVLCFGGQRYMKNREAFDLKNALAYWNLFLSVFSWCGAIRTVPHLLHAISTQDFHSTVCTPPEASFGNGAAGLWVQLFIFSKIPELVDTMFIVLRKKKLIFLHWYHHVTVLLYCWHAYATESSAGIYFVAMNYSVHAIMYGYYFLMAVGQKPKWLPPAAITLAQISQMFVGVGIVCASAIYYATGTPCAVDPMNLVAGGLMYASYLALFVNFAVQRFVLGPRRRAANKAKSL